MKQDNSGSSVDNIIQRNFRYSSYSEGAHRLIYEKYIIQTYTQIKMICDVTDLFTWGAQIRKRYEWNWEDDALIVHIDLKWTLRYK